MEQTFKLLPIVLTLHLPGSEVANGRPIMGRPVVLRASNYWPSCSFISSWILSFIA